MSSTAPSQLPPNFHAYLLFNICLDNQDKYGLPVNQWAKPASARTCWREPFYTALAKGTCTCKGKDPNCTAPEPTWQFMEAATHRLLDEHRAKISADPNFQRLLHEESAWETDPAGVVTDMWRQHVDQVQEEMDARLAKFADLQKKIDVEIKKDADGFPGLISKCVEADEMCKAGMFDREHYWEIVEVTYNEAWIEDPKDAPSLDDMRRLLMLAMRYRKEQVALGADTSPTSSKDFAYSTFYSNIDHCIKILDGEIAAAAAAAP